MSIEDHDLSAEDAATFQAGARRDHWDRSLHQYKQDLSGPQNALLGEWMTANPGAREQWAQQGLDELPTMPSEGGYTSSPGMTSGGMNYDSPIPGITQPLPTKWQLGDWAEQRGKSRAGLPTRPAAPTYGHISTLTEQQADAFRMMMLVLGHNASVTGRGSVREVPTKNGPAKAEM